MFLIIILGSICRVSMQFGVIYRTAFRIIYNLSLGLKRQLLCKEVSCRGLSHGKHAMLTTYTCTLHELIHTKVLKAWVRGRTLRTDGYKSSLNLILLFSFTSRLTKFCYVFVHAANHTAIK